MSKKAKKAAISALKPLYRALPIMIGVLLLVSLIPNLVPKDMLSLLFRGNLLIDPFIAAALGSVLAGNPVNSYIIGGEFLNLGISIVAVSAFLVSWVTVGIIQLPAETMMLGKRFGVKRNILSFVFSIAVAIITTIIMRGI